jgi:protein gp37
MAWRLGNMAVGLDFTSPEEVAGLGKYIKVISNRKWNGRIICDESALDIPLHWRKARRIFVCSMSDLFHPKVPFEFVDKVFAVAALCEQHTFLVLTKRIERAAKYMQGRDWGEACNRILQKNMYLAGEIVPPLPNLWLGVSVCVPEEKPKIDTLREIPAAVKYISFEPLLRDVGELDLTGIQWVIVGGESKGGYPGRECKVEWVRDIVRQFGAAGVPRFVKQLHLPLVRPVRNIVSDMPFSNAGVQGGKTYRATMNKHGAVSAIIDNNRTLFGLKPCEYERVGLWLCKDIKLFPEDLRVREYPL